MAISSTITKKTYVGNGSTTDFDFTFRVLDEDDLSIYLTNVSTGDITEVTSGYTITPEDDEYPTDGGTVTYPTSGTPLSSDYKITIIREMDLLQPTKYPNNTALKPKVVETSFDRAEMQIQQVAEVVDRTASFTVTVSDDVSRIFPSPVSDAIIGWNTAATALENKTDLSGTFSTTDVQSAIDSVDSTNSRFYESTGYGIISGGVVTTSGLTYSVTECIAHMPSGKRFDVAAVSSQPITTADSTKPRIDLIYISSTGSITYLAGGLGTAAIAGSRPYTLSTIFVSGDTILFEGITFTVTTATQDSTNFILGSDIATSMTNFATALNANSTISATYTATASSGVITLTEITAGGGNTPGTMTVTGTGVVSSGAATTSTAASTTAPTLPSGALSLAEIAVAAGVTSVNDLNITDTRLFKPNFYNKNVKAWKQTYGTYDNAVAVSITANDGSIPATQVMGIIGDSGLSDYSSRDSVGLYVYNYAQPTLLTTSNTTFLSTSVTSSDFATLISEDSIKIGMIIDTNETTKKSAIIHSIDSSTNTLNVSGWFITDGTGDTSTPTDGTTIYLNPATKVWGENINVELDSTSHATSGMGIELGLLNNKVVGALSGYDCVNLGTYKNTNAFQSRGKFAQGFYAYTGTDYGFVAQTPTAIGFYSQGSTPVGFQSDNDTTSFVAKNSATYSFAVKDASNNIYMTIGKTGIIGRLRGQYVVYSAGETIDSYTVVATSGVITATTTINLPVASSMNNQRILYLKNSKSSTASAYYSGTVEDATGSIIVSAGSCVCVISDSSSWIPISKFSY